MKIEMAKLLSEIKKQITTCHSENDIIQAILKSDNFLLCRQKIRNAEILKALQPQPFTENLHHLIDANKKWFKRLTRGINCICYEHNYKLSRRRNKQAKDKISLCWTQLSSASNYKQDLNPIYSSSDFFKFIMEIRNPNLRLNNEIESTLPTMVKLKLKWTSFEDLKTFFSPMFETGERQDCEEVPSSLGVEEALKICLRGCPLGIRNSLWMLSLGIYMGNEKTKYYEDLKESYLNYEMMIDSVIEQDVAVTVTNDDQYFVFVDFVYQVILPFMRDQQVARIQKMINCQFLETINEERDSVIYPPNGFVPYHGFSFLIAPLCYLYTDPVDIYFVFRAFFERHFTFLTTISSHEHSILSLSVQFEQLLVEREPNLCFHIKICGLFPLSIAFKWIFSAFAGFLSNDQLLCLWDRIIGSSSLLVLPVLAAAIISFRKKFVLSASSFEEVESVFDNITDINIVDVLKEFII